MPIPYKEKVPSCIPQIQILRGQNLERWHGSFIRSYDKSDISEVFKADDIL